jgi:hypothetical protein
MGLEGEDAICKRGSQRNTFFCRLYFRTLRMISSVYSTDMTSYKQRREDKLNLLNSGEYKIFKCFFICVYVLYTSSLFMFIRYS